MEDKTEEEFRRKGEFQGFLDGFEGNSHKHRGPRGSPEQKAAEVIESILSRVDDRIGELVSSIVNENKGVQDDLRRVAVEISKTSYRTRYGEQYSLGVASRGLVL